MSTDMVDHSIVLFLEWNVLASLFPYAIKCSEIVFSIVLTCGLMSYAFLFIWCSALEHCFGNLTK